MIENLTGEERTKALILSGLTALIGLMMAAAGRGDPMGVHGFIVLLASVFLFILILRSLDAPEPADDRAASYYDDPIKLGLILAMIWAVVALFVGVWVASELAWPVLNLDTAWLSFGRLRPVHTTGVIFGFGGNALIATSFHVMQRTTRARLPDQVTPWFVLLGYNLFVVLAVTGYMMGVTRLCCTNGLTGFIS